MAREYYSSPFYEELVASTVVHHFCFHFPTEHLQNSQT
jgi:hypothetical protein